jgi:ribosomal protein S8
MASNLTNILSRLYVAEKKKKKLIVFSKLNCNFDLLNLLWKNGFIYGYNCTAEGKVTVFLKYLQSGVGLFSKVVCLKKQKVSLRQLKSLYTLNKNDYYLVLTSTGVSSIDHCISVNISGFLIARL